MNRSEIKACLRELELATTRTARARMLLHDLAREAPRMGAPMREQLLRAAASRGLPFPSIEPAPLRVGEAWVLLFEAPSHGHVARLRAVGERHGDRGLDGEARRAHRGLIAAAARAGRRVDLHGVEGVDVYAPFGCQIEGSSLGLSLAIATLSALTRCAPDPRTACSAQLRDDGSLAPVEHLGDKLAGLARAEPRVTHVVVATGQDVGGYGGPLELVSAATLEEALPRFGLALSSLEEARFDAYESAVRNFVDEHRRLHDAATWTALSHRALEAAHALGPDAPELAAQAFVHAALFAVHAGDASGADAVLRRIPAEIAGG
jgi:hypothetical protein